LGLLSRLVNKDATISLVLSEDPPCVFADSVQLEQVLFNLCANARDAMPGGGQLTIRTELRDQMAVLIVSDTGTGMTPETLEHAFEPFFTTKGARGTGLGLATVHGIVTRLNGRIEVASTVGSGTTFTVLLPLIQAEISDQPAAAAVPAPAPHGTETVLVVDDEAAVRRVLSRILQEHGYHVLESDSFESAMQVYRFRRSDIRLVIADVGIGLHSGHQLAVELRNERPILPIVLLSAGDQPGAPTPSVSGIGIVVMQKPPVFDDLLRVVRGALDSV
ncbi:MAG TPA: ATP-binding protein, partial [Gemmatimonadales bacterium]|nr:ATP-binding protein [Gemmatimonadales bacterium]